MQRALYKRNSPRDHRGLVGKKILVVARRLLLAVCALGVLAGVAIMVMALWPRPVAQAQAQAQTAPPMLAIAAGTVTIRDEVIAVAAFEIDALEVSLSDFEACVRAGACQMSVSESELWGSRAEDRRRSQHCVAGRAGHANAAMNCVDWDAADAYCRWAGKRLPTREEWWHAIASKYPDSTDEVHRQGTPTPGMWLRAEWTASMGRAKGRGPWPSVRYAVTRNVSPESSTYNKPSSRWYATTMRAAWVSFRCAR